MNNLYKAIYEVQKAIEPMKKTGKNTMQNYLYFSEAQVSEKVKEEFDKHGLVFIPRRITNKEVRAYDRVDSKGNASHNYLAIASVEWTIAHADSGESMEGITENTALDTSDKAMNKAITAAVKYLFMKMFHISTGDDLEDDKYDTTPACKDLPSIDVDAPPCPQCGGVNRAKKEGQYGPYYHCLDCKKNVSIK